MSKEPPTSGSEVSCGTRERGHGEGRGAPVSSCLESDPSLAGPPLHRGRSTTVPVLPARQPPLPGSASGPGLLALLLSARLSAHCLPHSAVRVSHPCLSRSLADTISFGGLTFLNLFSISSKQKKTKKNGFQSSNLVSGSRS